MTKDYPMLIAAACEDGDLKGLAALAVELYGKAAVQEARAELSSTSGRSARSSYVYYARDGEQVKIGVSRNPWARIREFRTARPSITLAAVELGTISLERERHSQFKHARISSDREWFRWCPEIATHVAAVALRDNDVGTPPSPPQVSPSFPTPHITPSFPPPSPTTSTARERLLCVVPDRLSWEGEMTGALQGMHGTLLTAEQLEVACRDYLGNGGTRAPSLRHFRAYIRDAGKPDKARGGDPTNPFDTPETRAMIAKEKAEAAR